MTKYIKADEFKREMEKYLPEDRELALKVLKRIKTADEEKIATDFCMKRGLVMVTMDLYEKLIACYERRNSVL